MDSILMQPGGGPTLVLADGAPRLGLTLSALLHLGVPLLLLLLGAGLTAAFAADAPLLALVGLLSLPALALVGAGGRSRLWLRKAPQYRQVRKQGGEQPEFLASACSSSVRRNNDLRSEM